MEENEKLGEKNSQFMSENKEMFSNIILLKNQCEELMREK